MEKEIRIGTHNVTLKATGNTPRLYRNFFGKDLLVSINELGKHIKGDTITPGANLEICENLAYVMAYQHDNTIGTIEQWLDQFGSQDIYNAMGAIFLVWAESQRTTSVPKKQMGD